MDQWLPQDTMEKLAAIKPHRSGEGPDIPRWRWEKYNDFSVRSAYKRLSNMYSAPVRELAEVGRPSYVERSFISSFHFPSLSGYNNFSAKILHKAKYGLNMEISSLS
ncbi:hypothetical protein V6N13_033894 [Hibiscus sabdariffa]